MDGEVESNEQQDSIPWDAICNILYMAKVFRFESGLGWCKEFAEVEKWLVANGYAAPEYDPGSREAYARALARYERPGSRF